MSPIARTPDLGKYAKCLFRAGFWFVSLRVLARPIAPSRAMARDGRPLRTMSFIAKTLRQRAMERGHFEFLNRSDLYYLGQVRDLVEEVGRVSFGLTEPGSRLT